MKLSCSPGHELCIYLLCNCPKVGIGHIKLAPGFGILLHNRLCYWIVSYSRAQENSCGIVAFKLTEMVDHRAETEKNSLSVTEDDNNNGLGGCECSLELVVCIQHRRLALPTLKTMSK